MKAGTAKASQPGGPGPGPRDSGQPSFADTYVDAALGSSLGSPVSTAGERRRRRRKSGGGRKAACFGPRDAWGPRRSIK